MKNSILFAMLALLPFLVSCGLNEIVEPETLPLPLAHEYVINSSTEPSYAHGEAEVFDVPCELGYIEVMEKTVKFVRTSDVDTIMCTYLHRLYGWTPILYIDGQTDWDCVALPRNCESYQLTLQAGNIVCRFTVPGGVDCENH